MKRILFLLALTPLLISAQITIKKPEVVFDQLIGTWQFGNNPEFETWTKSKSTYYGKIFSVTNGDTTTSEQCRIYKLKGKYYFEQNVVISTISSVSTYQLIALDQKLMEFENKNLSFPQKIGYEWIANELLVVVQEGLVQGKTEFLKFSYKKVR
jgi:hypothetical protein